MSTKVNKIRAVLGFHRVPDADLLSRLNAVHDGMNGNPAFPSPPVDMATFKTAIDSFSASIAEALDGGKKATSGKNKQREAAIKIATQLGHYVEATCNDDLATFNSSGFATVPHGRTPPQPLPPASISKLSNGSTSGQLVVKITGHPKALTYDLRYTALANGTPGPWIDILLTSAKAVTINNLVPGTTYQFQVRALGRLGYTDWSDPVSLMCM